MKISAASSKGEAKRLIKQGAVKICFDTINEKNIEKKSEQDFFQIAENIEEFIIKSGKKKIFKIKLKKD